MGALFIFDEEVSARVNDERNRSCSVEVLDNHGNPEVRIGPVDAAYQGWTAEFKDWSQFERFVDAVNSLHDRLRRVKS